MSKPVQTDARLAPRVAVDAFVRVSGSDSREFVFRTRDLSETGLFLYTRMGQSYPFRTGQSLDLELFEHENTVLCQVVVARVVEPGSAESDHYPTGLGVRITAIDDENLARLRALVAQIGAGRVPY